MKILFYIVFIIGLLRLVSLFSVIVIELYHKVKSKFKNEDNTYLELVKTEGMYKASWFYIIPTIGATITNTEKKTYLEFTIKWLVLEYYLCYALKYDDDEIEL